MEKYNILFEKIIPLASNENYNEKTKQILIYLVENEFHSLREQLFNLRACGVIENPNVYLHRLKELIEDETKIINEISNVKK